MSLWRENMSELLPNKLTKSKKQIAYERIKEEITNNRFKPGTLLVERQLCEALNISRTPVREALKQLINEGLVDFINGKGAFVTNVTYEDIIEIYTIREVLEGLACRLAAQLISDERIGELENIYKNLIEAVDSKELDLVIKEDLKFHNCIIESTGNHRLKNMIENMQDQIKRITYTISDDQHRKILSLKHHKGIFEAIRLRDADKAEQIMKVHIRNSKEYHISKMDRYKSLF